MPKNVEKIIKDNNLTKKFNSFTAVDNISFEVEKSEIFAFLGPNGAGKTTTIKMLTTLLKPTNGSIEMNKKNVVENSSEARTQFGIVFQDPSLDDELTAFENIELQGMPLFFFSGALFPLTNAPKILKLIAMLNPLSYGVDGLRSTLTSSAHFSFATNFGFLSVFTIAFLVLGSYLFSRIQL